MKTIKAMIAVAAIAFSFTTVSHAQTTQANPSQTKPTTQTTLKQAKPQADKAASSTTMTTSTTAKSTGAQANTSAKKAGTTATASANENKPTAKKAHKNIEHKTNSNSAPSTTEKMSAHKGAKSSTQAK